MALASLADAAEVPAPGTDVVSADAHEPVGLVVDAERAARTAGSRCSPNCRSRRSPRRAARRRRRRSATDDRAAAVCASGQRGVRAPEAVVAARAALRLLHVHRATDRRPGHRTACACSRRDLGAQAPRVMRRPRCRRRQRGWSSTTTSTTPSRRRSPPRRRDGPRRVGPARVTSSASTTVRSVPDVCLIAFAWRAHADLPLVVAGTATSSSRGRPRPPLVRRRPAAVAGRDLRGGGTWMGVVARRPLRGADELSRPGSAYARTRRRAASWSIASSRRRTRRRGARRDRSDAHGFNGFNLLAAPWSDDAGRMAVVAHPGRPRSRRVATGIHGLSNASLDTPWPKVDASIDGTRRQRSRARAMPTTSPERLFALLADRRVAAGRRATGDRHPARRRTRAVGDVHPHARLRHAIVDGARRRPATDSALFVERRCEPDCPRTNGASRSRRRCPARGRSAQLAHHERVFERAHPRLLTIVRRTGVTAFGVLVSRGRRASGRASSRPSSARDPDGRGRRASTS